MKFKNALIIEKKKNGYGFTAYVYDEEGRYGQFSKHTGGVVAMDKKVDFFYCEHPCKVIIKCGKTTKTFNM